MRTSLISTAWVVGSAAFVGFLMAIELDLNFFDWKGNWHFQGVASMAGVLALLVGAWFLSLVTTRTVSLVIAAVSCCLLIGCGIFSVTPEPLGNPGQWFSRGMASPVWYRWGRVAVASAPLIILAGSSMLRTGRRPRQAT
ncbi:MAG: hypothetical protein V4662_19490 [Verrucomicrobiota bacterium]